ncbi:MAG: LCP family protein [Anaerolineae bacterium]|nr:LCP family protein [Thermoflexales bacterium]MDW8407427.1 LCP family protein [Anaerolineae bacterium]
MLLKRKTVGIMLAIFAFSVAASVYGYMWGRDYVANQLKELPPFYAPTPVPTSAELSGAGEPQITLRAWDGKERVNMLLMGIDQRDGDNEPAYRTDTMMVLTLDPLTLDAGILSIPRDLWVPIPGFDNGRINTANFLGDLYDYPGGGPALAVRTVEQMLGVPIHFYARVNFTAFEDLVDRIGGIDVDVPYDIYDPQYPSSNYGTEVFSITKGLHHMDGALALKFARTRYTLPNGDFDRARNQQLVLKAIKDKLKEPHVLFSLFASAPEIVARLSASVKTNLSIEQIQQLAALAVQVDSNQIKTAVLDQNYTEFATTLTDPPQQVQIPIRSQIARLRETFFSATPRPVDQTGNAPAANNQTP